ncbi:MAG: glycosyltransferase family 4 protein, partial [Pseudomonadota bacterium]
AGGFLRPESLPKIKRPIVWTLHDMWAFSGGCHYDDECGRLRDSCGSCPLLGSKVDRDLSRKVWQRKYEAYARLPIVVVSTSKWLGDVARSSSVFRNKRIEVIPNNVDIERYKPISKQVAREAWNLPQDKKLVLFSAFSATADKRKGHQFLLPAIERLAAKGLARDIELVIIGASEPPKGTPDIGLKTHYVGRLSDEISQVLLYSAADLLVAPSTQENLSNTVMESMSCGTPVVAFNIGGMPDMIDHMETGYLAKAFDPTDLADGIEWVLERSKTSNEIGARARDVVCKRYTADRVAQMNLDLYEDILKNRDRGI